MSIGYLYQANLLPSRKKKIPSLRGVHSQVLQNVIKRLDLAFEDSFVGSKQVRNRLPPLSALS